MLSQYNLHIISLNNYDIVGSCIFLKKILKCFGFLGKTEADIGDTLSDVGDAIVDVGETVVDETVEFAKDVSLLHLYVPSEILPKQYMLKLKLKTWSNKNHGKRN